MYICMDVLETVPQRWELYRLLAEPMRLRLLALAAEEELSIGELAEVLGESQPNVSRHVAALKQAGLVALRREGTRALVSLRDDGDLVVKDALASGRALCEADGSLKRLGDVIRARDAIAREFFDTARKGEPAAPTGELGAYLAALAPLIPNRALAVDAGTGDGSMLEVLSPVFDRVIAVDRSETQLAMARARVKHRGLSNVTLVRGELDGAEVLKAAAGKADVVFAVRLLHHAPKPAAVLRKLAELCRPGGALVVLDYARHDDERMREQADLWLGFSPEELRKLATAAGLQDARISAMPSRLIASGPDAHLPWQMLVAHAVPRRRR
jgi:DNA-binding transcriptional ArsR family regulator/protein-L-isoaspartate O-methyltransferase